MNTILGDLVGINCFVYMDDIIVYSTSLQEHMVALRNVLKRLSEANLKIQLEKCEFLKNQTEFLGHIVTPEGVKPNPDRVPAIKKFPIPKTAKEIKQFLGFAGYCRKFIKYFAKITKPLTNCLKKNAKLG